MIHGADSNVYLKPYKAGNIVDWCRDHDIWYLKMDIEIPEICIKEAQEVYDQGFFVDHRYGDGDGWCSAAIHSFVH